MDFNADYFSLLDLPRRFFLDAAQLDAHYRAILSEVHPDKFVQSGSAEQRLSLQWATRLNEAYQILKNPLSRACYLLTLAGHETLIESNTAMPSDFLIEQMEWREAVFEARGAGQVDELNGLQQRVKQQMEAFYTELARLFDEAEDYQQAADGVRRLMFLDKLRADINEAIALLDE